MKKIKIKNRLLIMTINNANNNEKMRKKMKNILKNIEVK
jgi:hypothetical protein